MSEYIKAVTAADFEQEVLIKSQQSPVLVDFWADWCEPCKQLMPVLHSLVEFFAGTLLLAKVNTDEEQELAMHMGIRSLPTVALFIDGDVAMQFSGVKTESEIKKLLAPYLDNKQPQDNLASEDMQKAIESINQGETQQAIAHLKNDGSLKGQLLLIKIYLQEGQIDNARLAYEQLDEKHKKDEQANIVKITLDLIELGHNTKNEALQNAIEHTITLDPSQGIEQLLQVLSDSKGDDKDETKKALIIAFNLIKEAKLLSQFRRKMSALIF